MVKDSQRTIVFREEILAFIQERRDAKVKDRDGVTEKDATDTEASDADTSNAEKAINKYAYDIWLESAARRVAQIQVVTHTSKAIHPDAKGSSLRASPDALHRHDAVGTHALGESLIHDVVGNAAALDVYKFLKREVDGRPLLHWFEAADSDLLQALDEDVTRAAGWAEAFASIGAANGSLRSHTLAKQVYWCVGESAADDASYHLLQPMFPSSLVQAVHLEIDTARFGEDNKLARQALREKQAHPGEYRDYGMLVARKLGGTKPQNISQLNSERRGVNYLLPSIPPTWTAAAFSGLHRRKTAFQDFARFDDVPQILRQLSRTLRDGDANMHIRSKRTSLEEALGTRLAAFSASIQGHLPAGWTRGEECNLPLTERLWLDPGRAELGTTDEASDADKAFSLAYASADWVDDIAARFGRWLNAVLRRNGVIGLSDTEFSHWAKQILLESGWQTPRIGEMVLSARETQSKSNAASQKKRSALHSGAPK